MNQATGTVMIKVNNKLLRSKKGAKLNFGGVNRTSHYAGGSWHYSEEPVPAKIEATLSHTADTDVGEVNGFVNATAIFESDVGVAYLIKGAQTSEPCELTGGEGDLSFKMEGEPAVKI